jgi:hypothetical protein
VPVAPFCRYGRALFHCRRDRMLGRERLASSRTDCEIFARNELQTLVERAHVSRDGECSYRSSGRSRPVFSPQERFDCIVIYVHRHHIPTNQTGATGSD